ncbi:hypothetical protein, partial [Streptomyces microflavus]|uniref:hypothetical protein n=1 Tax=Streptomyces microflavus TaxID=1919 RepID=UPI0033D3B6DC
MDSVGQTTAIDHPQDFVSDDPGSLDAEQARAILQATAFRRVSPAPGGEALRGAGAAPGGPAEGQSTYYANNVSPDEENPGPDQAKEVWQ